MIKVAALLVCDRATKKRGQWSLHRLTRELVAEGNPESVRPFRIYLLLTDLTPWDKGILNVDLVDADAALPEQLIWSEAVLFEPESGSRSEDLVLPVDGLELDETRNLEIVLSLNGILLELGVIEIVR